MPQLAAQSADQHAQRPVLHGVFQQKSAQKAGDDRLTHVEQDDAQRVFRAVGAVEVGQAGIAAAVLPHVVFDDEMAHHHRSVETSQEIPQQHRDEHHARRYQEIAVHYPSSSPFCRMVIWMGVPSSPNTLRSWFSKYR